jgi:hypothetical protein
MNKEQKEFISALLKENELQPLFDLSGYCIKKDGLIHFFDKQKNFEVTKY